MKSKAATPEEYLAELPADRREAISAVREVIRKNLPNGYEEGMQYGMIGYFVPHSVYPAGYHCDKKQPVPFAHLASQKHHMSLYLFCLYCDPESRRKFLKHYEGAGKDATGGLSCIRFKRVSELPLDLIGETIASIPVEKFLAEYEKSIPASRKK